MPRNGRPWTSDEDDALRKALVAGTALPELSRVLDRTVSSIKSRAYILRLSLKPAEPMVPLTPSARMRALRMSVSAGGAGLKAKKGC